MLPRRLLLASAGLTSGNRIACVGSASLQIELLLHLLEMLGHADLATACGHALQYHSDRQHLVAQMTGAGVIRTDCDSAVFKAAQWIEQHGSEVFTVDALADQVAVSRRTLLRHSQQAYGVSPLGFVRRVRVKRAQMLLEISMIAVVDIAQTCGYNEVGTFRRAFLQETGMSPLRWRERYSLRPPRRRWRAEEVEAAKG